MVWAVPDQMLMNLQVRHTYKYQSNDGVVAYYEYHDGWSFSRQIIEDPFANTRIEIDFIKQIMLDDDKDITS